MSYPDRARHTGCSNLTAALPQLRQLPQPRRATGQSAEPPPAPLAASPGSAPALVETNAGRRWTKATAALTLAAATALTCYTSGPSAHSTNTAAARPASRPAATPTDSRVDPAHVDPARADGAHLDAGLRTAMASQARISLPGLAATPHATPTPGQAATAPATALLGQATARFAPPALAPSTAHSATFRMTLTPARPATPTPTRPASKPAAPASAPSSGARALSAAATAKGTPYVWGGTGPSGFDCSGLVQWAYRKAGITLPRSSQAQSTVGTPVSERDLQPGDLVFFYRPVSHVGIYLGGGQVLHAPEPGDVVKVSPISRMPFHNARRL